MTITVFTPAYNRSELLPVLYQSLCEQTFRDFEWLIVDDGSSDNTEDVVRTFIEEHKIDIAYFKKQNGGKHTAVNFGAQRARGELFFIVDSDDKLPKDSLALVNENYQPIKENPEFAGVCGLKAYFNGDLLPGVVDYEVLDCKGLDYYYRRKSDAKDINAIVVRTQILVQHLFPEFEGEKFCAESAIWNPICNDYYFRFFNRAIYKCEFLQDGLSANSLKARMKYPLSAMHIYSELCKFNVPYTVKIRSACNYWRFFYCNSSPYYPRISVMYFPFFIFGFIMHLKDLKLSKNRLKIGRER